MNFKMFCDDYEFVNTFCNNIKTQRTPDLLFLVTELINQSIWLKNRIDEISSVLYCHFYGIF